MNKLSKGMHKSEVIKLLTLPDEEGPTYQSIKKGQDPIGFRFVYLFRRDKGTGSQNDKNEKHILIYFNNLGKITSCHGADLPTLNVIDK